MFTPLIHGVVHSGSKVICTYSQWIEQPDYSLTRGIKTAYFDNDLVFISSSVLLDNPEVNENACGGMVKDGMGSVYIAGYESFAKSVTRYFLVDLYGSVKYFDIEPFEGRVDMKLTGLLSNGFGILADYIGKNNEVSLLVIKSSYQSSWEKIIKPMVFYSISSDILGNIYLGGYDENTYYAKIIKLDTKTGNRRAEIVYDQGYGVDLMYIDPPNKINIIGYAGNNNLYFARLRIDDLSPPAQITDLEVVEVSSFSATFTFTAVGDDENIGQANLYDIRCSLSPIETEEDFYHSSWKIEDVPTPASAGTKQNITISDLEPDTKYYFAIKVIDDAGNISDMSNVVSITTLKAIQDNTPPQKIIDLSLCDCSITTNSITLTWTAPNGNITNGTYKIIYDKQYPFTNIAKEIEFSTTTSPGNKEIYTITNLEQGEEYYFAVKTIDDLGNESELSNVVSVRTLLDVPYFNQASPPWGEELYAHTTSYISLKGCALTCLAMIVNYYKLYHPTETYKTRIPDTDPGKLNEWLKKNPKGYTGKNRDLVNWEIIYDYTNGAILWGGKYGKRDDKKLNEELKNKAPCILQVEYLYNGDSRDNHFVVAVGSCTTTYKIKDPGHSDVKTLRDEFIPKGATEPTSYQNNYIGIRRFRPGPGDPSGLFIDGWEP